MTESFFVRMLDGREPCALIVQDDRHAAILEPSPVAEGHAVVFPKRVVDAFFDLDDEELADLMRYCSRIARALKKEIVCDKVAVIVYGLKVRHAHVHLIPVRGEPGELRLDGQRAPADRAGLEALADRLRRHVR